MSYSQLNMYEKIIKSEYLCKKNIAPNLFSHGSTYDKEILPIYPIESYYGDVIGIPYQNPSFVLNFDIDRLASNISGFAKNFDPNILNPWGIMIKDNIIWVCNTDSGMITSYNLQGYPLTPVINVFGPLSNIAHPTGIVYNYNSSIFLMKYGPYSYPATTIVVTKDGTVHGYNFSLDPINTILLINNVTNNCVYTGVAILNDVLYVTDFYNKKIDAFNFKFEIIKNYLFIDEYSGDPIPNDYSPYNIIEINELLYVTYARQNLQDPQYEIFGRGNGYINIFSPAGIFIKRFASRGTLNTPWGIVIAPSYFGYPSGSMMIANNGDNTIGIFDVNGNFLGKLCNSSNIEICINGIRALAINPYCDSILYWSSSENNYKNGFIGNITTKNTYCL